MVEIINAITMTEIFWTLQAQNDLRELGKYLNGASSVYAESLLNAIYNAVGRLAHAPALSADLKLRRALHSIDVGNYQAIYSLRGSVITVLAIVPNA